MRCLPLDRAQSTTNPVPPATIRSDPRASNTDRRGGQTRRSEGLRHPPRFRTLASPPVQRWSGRCSALPLRRDSGASKRCCWLGAEIRGGRQELLSAGLEDRALAVEASPLDQQAPRFHRTPPPTPPERRAEIATSADACVIRLRRQTDQDAVPPRLRAVEGRAAPVGWHASDYSGAVGMLASHASGLGAGRNDASSLA